MHSGSWPVEAFCMALCWQQEAELEKRRPEVEMVWSAVCQPYASTAEPFPAPVFSLKVNVSLPSLCIWIKSLIRVATRIMEEGLFMTIGTLSVAIPLKTMSLPSSATTVSLHWRMRPHKPLATGLIDCKHCSGDHSSWEYQSALAMSHPEVSLPPFFLLLHPFCFLVSVWLFGTLTWRGKYSALILHASHRLAHTGSKQWWICWKI